MLKNTIKRKVVLAAIVAAAATAVGSAQSKDKLSVIFVSGNDTHGWGTHDHNPGNAILSESLQKALGDKVKIKMVKNGWPTKQDFKAADVCVVYSDGWNVGVLKGQERLDQIEKFMDSGKGVLRIHWATGGHAPENKLNRELFGGNMESDYSVHSTIWNQKFKTTKHQINNGVKPFELVDEGYFFMHWVDEKKTGVTDILTVNPGKNFKSRWVTPKARESLKKGEPQTVAWVYERPKGGRAFSYTGGHFHWDWASDNHRKVVLNAILWAGGKEVPKDGVISPRPDAKQMLQAMEKHGHKRKRGWTEENLQPLLDKLNEPGGKVDWRKVRLK